jgi:hypothetical protein
MCCFFIIILLLTFQVSENDLDAIYQLDLLQQRLCRLCVTWQAQVRAIPCKWTMPASWGPSEEDLRDALVYKYTGSWESGDNDTCRQVDVSEPTSGDEIGDEVGSTDEDEDDGDLLEAAEAVAFTDAYHDNSESDVEAYLDDVPDLSSPTRPPRKRRLTMFS